MGAASGLALAWAGACTLHAPSEPAAGGGSGAIAGVVASEGGSGKSTQASGGNAASGTSSIAGKSSSSSGGNDPTPSPGGSGGEDATGGASDSGGAADSGGAPAMCSPACGDESVCRDGACECAGTLAYCGGQCVDTKTDEAHCGACNKPCSSPRSCSNGKCDCPSGRTFCSDSCVDTKTDERNCGGCGTGCQWEEECTNGACKVCSTGCALLAATVSNNSSSPIVAFGFKLNPPVNLVNATITAHLYIASGVRPNTIQVHVDDSTDSSSTGIYTANPTVEELGWFDVKMSEVTALDIDTLDLRLQDFNGNGGVAIYLDSISISPAVVGPWDFTTSYAPLTSSLAPGVDPMDISGGLSWRKD